jgi:hypothetical protein
MNTVPLLSSGARPLPNSWSATRHRPRLFARRWLAGATIAGVLLQLALPTACADVMVSATAGGPDGSFEVTGSSSDFSGASHLHATASSGGTTSVNTGPLSSPNNSASFPHGAGRAEANGSTGMLRASGGNVVASGNFGGGGTAVIRDTITFLSPNPEITVHLDGSMRATDPGHAQMAFSIFLPGNGGVESGGDTGLLSISAHDSGVGYHTITGDWVTNPSYYIEGVPDVFEYTLSIPPAWLQFFGNTFALGFSLTAGAHDEGSEHFAQANFENTAYIGIKGPYASANGYSYEGFAPPASVPDSSATITLLGFAALGLGLMAKARRTLESV